jgi:hypothetical protein
VLREPAVREPLLDALAGIDRLVLLGDVLELRHGPLREALTAAEPALHEIGEALGADREVVVVPGNHDHRLLRGWLERWFAQPGCDPLRLDTDVQWLAGEPLDAIAGSLSPARVRACYPGVWLREDVYAIHGHYCDRHVTVPTLERLGAGVMARLTSERSGGPLRIEDYEATLGPM